MKNRYLRTFAFSLVAMLALAGHVPAASVSPSGYTNDFGTLPLAADWATFSRAGGANDTYDWDVDVNANITAGGVTAQPSSNATDPAGALGTATWSSTGFYLQTRPTGNRYTALMGKFVNNSGTNASEITLSYHFTIAAAGAPEDAGKGTRGYYSLSGLAGSWTNLAAFNSIETNAGSSTVTTTLALNWSNGAAFYLLWADDNATGPQGATDPADQIDNFSLQVTAGLPLTLACLLNAPTNNAVLLSGTALTAASTIANGTAPFSVEYFTNSGAGNTIFASAGTNGTPPYNVSLGALPVGTYNIYAVVTDSAGTPESATSRTNTFLVVDPLAVALTAPAQNATFDNVTPVTGAAMVSGGTAPYSVQFYLDNSARGAPVTSSPYERNLGALFVGDHTIYAAVTDALGWVSNSPPSLVHISGPLAALLTPTNGASYVSGQAVILEATVGGGTAPYNVAFYTNGQLVGSVSAPPFATNLGSLPAGSYTAVAVASDSSVPIAQQADSGTNTFSVIANPLVVSLTSPTSGQSVTAGAPLALSATATVAAPITVSNVQFFFDGASVGVDATAPYAGSATPAAGSHTVYAVATDSLGRRSFSATNQFTATTPTGNNDNFANAIPLFGPIVTTTGNNVGATKQFGQEPTFVGGDFGGASVWWTWTATASGQTTIDTMGSDFNTLLGIFTGTNPNQLALVADNNDYEGNTWSRVQFNAIAGTIYRIYVDGFRIGGGPGGRASMGNIVLHIQGVGGLQINTPTNGMVLTVGEPIPISVTIDADFPNPPASRVDFYHGGSIFASSSNAPFSAVATNWPIGSNSFYVVAIDNTGSPIQSGVINVLVQNIGVTLLTPAEDTIFSGASPITVSAWGYLPTGSITNIEFLVDGVKFGEDATSPFSAAWTNVTGGSHRLTAVGRSDTGVSYNSQAANIGVATSLIVTGAVWKYLDNGSDQGTNWIASDFNDSSWASGAGELGYGDGDETTVVEDNATPGYGPNDMDRYITTYFRRAFVVSNAAGFARLTMVLERDDAAVVYLNGQEVFRTDNLPAGPTNVITFTTLATGQAVEDSIDTVMLNATNFVEGTNVFAIEIHQQAPNSSDISFNLSLVGLPVIIHNLSPLVAITNLVNNQSFRGPATIPIEASASDLDGSVAKVEFFADGVKLGEDLSEPYGVVWINPPLGPHALTALATDDQGATQLSAPINIVVYDADGTPFARITAPPDGAEIEGGTNIVLTAYANALNGVTNVQFFSNGAIIGEDDTAPYGMVWNAPFGSNGLTAVAADANGVRGTSAVASVRVFPNTTAPSVATQAPLAAASVTNLTNITVTFSERVQNVDAADLLVNGVPATGVSGSGSNYVFRFLQPLYGAVEVTWAAGHGITDFGFPADLPFDGVGAGARWSYTLLDRTPPLVVGRMPAAGSLVTNLQQLSVTFSEAVTGVDAADLLVAGAPAFGVSGSGANYTFLVSQPLSGTINVTWSTNSGIFDLSDVPNAFVSSTGGWNFNLDTRTVLVQSNSTWRLATGLNEASSPVSAWRQPGFDDSSFSNAPAPFFFGDPYTNATITGTLLSDMLSNYTCIFLRQEFTVMNRAAITNLLLNHQSDDGFIAWLNGVEVLRYNVPAGELAYSRTASVQANEPNNAGAAYIAATLANNAASRLVNGVNILAVQAFNQALTSSDFGFNAQLYTFIVDPATVAPRLFSAAPAPGELLALTNITITFSEGVSGVDAGDLLINGVPATTVASTTNTTYAFGFAQPGFGTVLVTWAANHGIADFDSPPKPFDGAAAGSSLTYSLYNPAIPRIATQAPLAGSVITGLTSIAVSFTEPVTNVDAGDLLVNGTAAIAVSGSDSNYTFTVTQPGYGTVAVRWSTNHGIQDFDANSFEPTRFGGQWNYSLVNPVPTVTLTSPSNNAVLLAPVDLTLRATATDLDGTIVRVEFFEGANKLGEATNTPYTLSYPEVEEGAYSFRAVATDNSGFMATSAPVSITVVTSLPITLVRGPYLQSGSSTGVLVRWRSDLFSDAIVFYGTDPDNLTNLVVRRSHTNEHIIAISGLEADTKYYYSIGNSAQRLASGPDYFFNTAPVPGTIKPVRFWFLGDAGTAGNGSPDRQASTRDAFYNFAATNGPTDIMLMLGDNAYNSGTDNEHQAAIFDMYPTTLRNKFLYTTLGNHETAQSTTASDFPYLNIFSLPQNGEAGGVPSGSEKYYSMDYANVHFVCLDSMTSGRTGTSPMAQWLENDLAATAQEWIIVFFHHSLYTKGTHDSDSEGDLVELRQNIIPILEANGVDLVLMGHSHVYERSFLLDGHYGLSSTFTASMKVDGGDGRVEGSGAYRKNELGRGVVYTIAGSSGQALGGPLNHPAHFFSLNELGSVVIDVNSNRLDAQFLNASGVSRDHYTVLKPTPPPAPASLVARALGASDIALTWYEATNEMGFIIERSTDGIDFVRFATNTVGVTNALDSGLSANTTYFYRVRAFNERGESEPSIIASATTVPTGPAPTAPDRLVANAGNGLDAYRSQILLRWRDRSANEAGFLIERSTDGNAFAPLTSVGANVTLYVDRKLDSATIYYYRVRGFNPGGDSAPSNLDADQTHPQSDIVGLGETALFHAGVEGVAPISYQWRFMGTNLQGATGESLTITNAQGTNEGTYTVVITDATGAIVSNPAWLFVLAPPFIVEHPASRTNVIGDSSTFQVVADGTPPFFYQWRKNGVNVAGAHAAQFTVGPVSFSDEADYDVVVLNDIGSITSHIARLTVSRNRPPALPVIPDYFVNPLSALVVSNTASDPDAPTNRIAYSLAPGAPTNATINASNGTFRWTPLLSQAPSTNVITVRATDNGAPPLSDAKSFVVTVNDYLQVTAGSTVLYAGTNGSVALDFFSTAEMLGLDCVLQFAGDRLSNFSVEALDPATADVTLAMPDLNTALVTFTAAAGRTMQFTQHLARLHFTAAAGQTSAFVPLDIGYLTNTMARSSVEPTLFSTDGRVAVVGAQALLEARLTPSKQRQLVIYGKPGTTYNLQSRFNLAPTTPWANRVNVTPASTAHTLTPPSPAAPIIFYRLVEP